MKKLFLTLVITSFCSSGFAVEATKPEQNQTQAAQAPKNNPAPALLAANNSSQEKTCPNCGKKMSDCQCPSNPTRVNPDFRLSKLL